MTLSYPDAMAEVMEHLCIDSAHGYSQPNRQGIGTGGSIGETITLSDGTKVGISKGDRDCSSAVIECIKALGLPTGGAYYTGDMRSKLVSTGNWQVLSASTWSSAKRGDILLNDNKHVAMALGNGKLGEFVRSETGGITGKVGDQTGYEAYIHDLYNDNWKCVLRYCGPVRAGSTSNESSTPASSSPTVYMELVSGSTYKCVANKLWVHSSPDTKASTRTGFLTTGKTINMSTTKSANGYLWGVYRGYSNNTLYVAIKKDGSASTSTTSTAVPAGYYKLTMKMNVRKGAGTNYAISGALKEGHKLYLDGTSMIVSGVVWGRYLADSNYYRWIAVRTVDGKTVYAKKV